MIIVFFIALLIGVLVMLFTGINTTAAKILEEPGSFIFRTMLLIAVWIAYIFTLTFSGILTNFSLPPRVPLLLVLPFLIFLIYFFVHPKFKQFIAAVPPHWPVYFQTFRIAVELVIYYMFIKQIVPVTVTFEGRNYDILAGLTAPIVGYAVAKGINGSKILLFLWNVFGLLLLLNVVFLFNTMAYFPHMWGSEISLLKPKYGMFPLALLAGIFMPVAVFMHVLSLVRMFIQPQGTISVSKT